MPGLPRTDLLLFVSTFGLATGVSTLVTPLVGRWASAHGIVARPRRDRWHTQPTPLLGGIAIYLAATLGILAFARIDGRLTGLLAGGTLLFATGLVDDIRHLRPHTKLIIQILAACALVVSGIRVETERLAAVALPLTIVWVVGITNAFNLLDNMDGLSAGTAIIVAFFLFAFSVTVGNVGLAILCLAIAGGALGFLRYNFNPARIFMGDSGSMFLGFTLSGIALLGTREMASDVFFVLLVPAAMMGLPIFDTTLVTIVRTVEGRSLAQGGRDHLSHRLVALGLSERQAVVLLYLLAAGFGSLGLIARSVGFWVSLAVAGGLLAAVLLFGAYLAQVRLYGPLEFARAERSARLAGRPIVNGMIMFKRELGLAMLDFILICVAYLGAYLLRFGYQDFAPQSPDVAAPWPGQFSESLPFVIAVKLATLLAFQVYRGMLRYVGVADLVTLGKATICSSLILGALLPLLFRRDESFPRSVLAIDWLLFTTLLVGSRASFAALTDTFARIQSQRVPRLLLLGAGDLGELVLRSLIRAHPTAYQPVGFLDLDPDKRNRTIHGVRVLGALDDLERVASERDVDLVVLALGQREKAPVEEARERCALLGLPCYQAAAFLEMHFAGERPPEALGNPEDSRPSSVG